MDFGGREDEFDVCWWLLKGLEESIEGSFGEHMNLVDDINLVFGLGWLELGSLDNITDIINPCIGRSIDLDDIQESPFVECSTIVTDSTWIPIRSQRETIHSLGEDPCHTRLPGPA